MIGGTLTLSSERFQVVDYLIPMARQTEAVFIKNTGQQELSWRVDLLSKSLYPSIWPWYVFRTLFLYPFTTLTWMAAFFTVLTMAIVRHFLRLKPYECHQKHPPKLNHHSIFFQLYKSFRLMTKDFILMGSSYFGGGFLNTDITMPLQILGFTVVLMGSVAFLCYQVKQGAL